MRSVAALLLVTLAACASADTPLPPPKGLQSSAASKETYWKKAFPNAAKFDKQVIPADQIAEADIGNNLFYEVKDAGGVRIGYLRDFVGPVSTHGACACDPINVTLAFDANGAFSTLISPAPLTKYGHEPMTAEEIARLIAILKNPPEQLTEVQNVEDLVDATSGATKPQYAEFVVHRAALETRRLVQIVSDTQGIISGAPEASDKRDLDAILSKQEGTQRMNALAVFLQKPLSVEVGQRAYVVMGREYLKYLHGGGSLDEKINDRILDSSLAENLSLGLQVDLCSRLADERIAGTVAERCATQLEKYPDSAPVVGYLRGTVLFLRGNMKAAAPELEKAAQRYSFTAEPRVHARFATAQLANGQVEPACAKALLVHRTAPLMPEVRTLVEQCAKADKSFTARRVAQEKEDRNLWTEKKEASGPKIPVLDVDDAKLVPVKLDVAEGNQVTVLMFFATWCPHCQAELPKVSAFADSIAKNPKLKDRVRVIGVRTSTEREVETYEAFRSRFVIPFPVYTDAAMSLAFSAVVNATGVPNAFPTLLVVDRQGRLRYAMEPGEYRDTAHELEYATSALVDER